MTLLAAETADLAHGHADDARSRERFLHVVELERLDDCFDLLHRPLPRAAPCAARKRKWRPSSGAITRAATPVSRAHSSEQAPCRNSMINVDGHLARSAAPIGAQRIGTSCLLLTRRAARIAGDGAV